MTPLVLIPGMMCDARLFGPQITALSADRTIFTPSIGAHDTMSALAAEILKSAPPRFALAGLSMGGIVAMEIFRQAPERVERLALMDTNPLAEADEIKKRRGPQIAAVKAGGLRSVMRNEMKPSYLTGGPRRGSILDLCMAMSTDLGPDVFVNQSLALRDRSDQSDTLRSYHGPALILCGRDDQLCPVERHDFMHELMPQSSLTIVDGAAHLPTLEQPEITTLALRCWLEET